MKFGKLLLLLAIAAPLTAQTSMFHHKKKVTTTTTATTNTKTSPTPAKTSIFHHKTTTTTTAATTHNESMHATEQKTTSGREMPHPQEKQAVGGGANMVWVNSGSNVYHCPGDRYYGKTKSGKYMTESEAKAAHAHGVGGKNCFK